MSNINELLNIFKITLIHSNLRHLGGTLWIYRNGSRLVHFGVQHTVAETVEYKN